MVQLSLKLNMMVTKHLEKISSTIWLIEGTGIKCGGGGGGSGDTLDGGYKIAKIESVQLSVMNRRKIKITQEGAGADSGLVPIDNTSSYTNIYGKMGNQHYLQHHRHN